MSDVTDTYYAGDAFIGYGSQLKVGQDDGSPETFTAIPDVESITPGDATTGIVDVTHLRSLDRHREKKGTIRDNGPFTLMGNYRPTHGAHLLAGGDGFSATHNLKALWTNVTEANFELVYPVDASSGSPAEPEVLPFRGLITKYQVGALTLDGKTGFTVEITPLRAF
jgi:hypothetical protein